MRILLWGWGQEGRSRVGFGVLWVWLVTDLCPSPSGAAGISQSRGAEPALELWLQRDELALEKWMLAVLGKGWA